MIYLGKTILIEKKSRFVSLVYANVDHCEVDSIIKDIKLSYPDATHYCYGYLGKNTAKYDDDKEPHGTAGKPILQVIERKKLSDILVVVVRYFGGTKLGAGPLLRAYVKACAQGINEFIK